jgi:hypothetical protein
MVERLRTILPRSPKTGLALASAAIGANHRLFVYRTPETVSHAHEIAGPSIDGRIRRS